ncbi:Conserved_hypothetical protein [Hexamita inflata]|uniref:Uncharacterized protein n=1 Tax=Hexamita inflata TaxID=28002 RepID=A0AA86UW09_9EUKA|nr:Conserved hypothetical protein [Hexamita inflata]
MCQLEENNKYNQLRLPVFCDGFIYIQCGYKTCKLLNTLELVEIAEIPGAKGKPLLQYGRLYSYNEQLYCQSNNDIYACSNSVFKSIKQCFKQYQCYSWCNKSFFVSQQQLFILGENQNLIELCDLKNEDKTPRTVSFASGGTIVIHTKDCNYVWIAQMRLKGVVSKLKYDKRFEISQIHQICCLGDTGLQLKPQILEELFGWNYFQTVQEQYYEYQRILSQNQNYIQLQTSLLGLLTQNQININIKMTLQLKMAFIYHSLKHYTLQKSLLMNVIPVDENNYLSIGQNRIYVISRNCRILAQYPVQFSSSKTGEQRLFKKFHPYMFTPVICNNKVYIQYNNSILQVTGRSLTFIANGPDFTFNVSSGQKRRLFSFNNQLYWSGDYQFYQVTQKAVKQIPAEHLYFQNEVFTFNNRVFIQNSDDFMIYELQPNFQLKFVIQGAYVQFWSGGVAIMGDLVLNLEEMRIYEPVFQVFREENFILGNGGLELKSEIQMKIFGYAIQTTRTKFDVNTYSANMIENRFGVVNQELLITTFEIKQRQQKITQNILPHANAINKLAQKFIPFMLTFMNEPGTQ